MARCTLPARPQNRALSKTRFSPLTWTLLGLTTGGILAALIWFLLMARQRPRKPALW